MDNLPGLSAHYGQILETLLNQQDNNHPDQSVLRKNALQRLMETGFPSTRDEEWRFTNTKILNETAFRLADTVTNANASQEQNRFDNWPGIRLVFVNGQFMAGLSKNMDPNDRRLSIENTAFIADSEPDGFGLLHLALQNSGLTIRIADNVQLSEPIHLLFIASGADNEMMTPVCDINAGRNSGLTIIENFISSDQNTNFTNTHTRIRLSENASVRHIKIINENIRSYHYGQLRVDQERDSRFQSLAFLFGNKLNRNNISIILNGSGCESLMDGVFAGHRNQHHDVHTLIHHASPHCRSHELYRGILADESSAVFSGKIHVHPDAQKTDALQSNNCLLLSDQATINTKPQLEIYADDVKCTHGATVGQLNEDQIYYLRSRGIPEKKARNILTYAFAREIIEQVETEEVRNYIDQLLLNRLEEDMDFHK